ncbi:MAG TPA: hypothetical protein VHQ47_17760 [Phycisphaerae bacterium]|nr:hypothetical protein [Phycisphaerae bacterium]
MKLSIEVEGDEHLIGLFLGAGIRAANAASASPLPFNKIQEKVEAIEDQLPSLKCAFELGLSSPAAMARRLHRGFLVVKRPPEKAEAKTK